MSIKTARQAPSAVVLIRPHRFAPNQDTAIDNAFQALDPFREPAEIAACGYAEVTAAAGTLMRHGVRVHLFEDENSDRPARHARRPRWPDDSPHSRTENPRGPVVRRADDVVSRAG